jgi:hypothetical protein
MTEDIGPAEPKQLFGGKRGIRGTAKTKTPPAVPGACGACSACQVAMRQVSAGAAKSPPLPGSGRQS